MSLASLFDGVEVREALTADLRGELLEATKPEGAGRHAAATAAAMGELSAAGSAIGLSKLEMLLVKGASQASLTVVRPDALLQAVVHPTKGTAQVEKVLHAWASGASAPALPRPGPGAAPKPVPPPFPRTPATPAATPVPLAPTPVPMEASTGAAVAPPDDPWSAFRRSLVRGQLTEAAARRRELGELPATSAAGAEPLSSAEREHGVQVLLDGIGSILSGDGLGGARTLVELAAPSQQNLSFRWIALHWCSRASMRSGSFAAARQHAKEALLVSQRLDIDARAVSQWIAAEVLANEGDHSRALAWLGEARKRFERIADGWGLGQAWLSEAKVLVSLQREEEAVAAARQASAAYPAWEEPRIFLARRALGRGDLEGADGLLQTTQGPAAERSRAIVQAVRERTVTQADASEYLRECDAPPSARSIRALERIAGAAPRFVQAREALAWMLLKLGKYADASAIFRGLLAQQLGPADRASVMLGLACSAHAQQAAKDPDATLRAAASTTAPARAAEPAPLPTLSTSSMRGSQVGGASVFSGQLSVFALPDVLEFLRSARRTGLLVCSSTKGMAALRFAAGFISGVGSAPGVPGLGDLLLRARKISTVALRAVSNGEPADRADLVLGERLVKEGLVDAPALQEAVEQQIELTLRELVQWKDGEFAFNHEEAAEPAAPWTAVKVDVQGALLEVFKQMDEASRSAKATGAKR
jgi:tetratricopeptide (TPR) repeat protein